MTVQAAQLKHWLRNNSQHNDRSRSIYTTYVIFPREERLSQSELQNVRLKSRSAKDQSDPMNNHLICLREKLASVRNLIQELALGSSDFAEKLDTGWFGGRY